MADHTVIILAGGEQTRWRDGPSKMLLPVLGQPLIRRTCNLLHRASQPDPLIYSDDDDVAACGEKFWPEKQPPEIIAAIAATAALWKGTVTILLGDVIFSGRSIDWLASTAPGSDCSLQLFGKTGPNRFTGKPWPEVYGLRFLPGEGQRLLDAIDVTLKGPCERKKIWELYRTLLELPQTEEPFDEPPQSEFFHEIPDWTDDIDNADEYMNIIRLLGKAIGDKSIDVEP